MKINPYILIIIIIIFLPSEDFILKWLPVSDKIYSISRFFSELFIYSLFLLIILHNLKKSFLIKKTPIDVPLILFILVGIVSIILNHAPLLGGLIGIRTLLRYVIVFYILTNIKINNTLLNKTIYIILIMGAIQSIIGIFQHFNGISNFWIPRETNLEIAGYKKEFTVLTSGIEQGAIIGTLGHSVNLALFLLIQFILSFTLIINKFFKGFYRFILYIFTCLTFIAILFTYSRGVIISSLIAIIIILYLNKKKLALLTISSIISLIFILMILININTGVEYKHVKKEYVNPIENIRMIFSNEYLEATEGSRQWILQEIGGFLLKNIVLIGFSPDEFTTREKIANTSKGNLERILYYKAFEDVYWIAILAYFGIIGLSLFLYILYKLFKTSIYVMYKTNNYIYYIISQSLITLLIIIIPLTFIVRTFEFRAFGFYFWFLAGLVTNEYLRIKRAKNESTSNK